MELNEENIEEIAKTLTVEEMEQDYRNWAEDTREPIKMTLTNSNTSKNKIKLRKRFQKERYLEVGMNSHVMLHLEKLEIYMKQLFMSNGNINLLPIIKLKLTLTHIAPQIVIRVLLK